MKSPLFLVTGLLIASSVFAQSNDANGFQLPIIKSIAAYSDGFKTEISVTPIDGVPLKARIKIGAGPRCFLDREVVFQETSENFIYIGPLDAVNASTVGYCTTNEATIKIPKKNGAIYSTGVLELRPQGGRVFLAHFSY